MIEFILNNDQVKTDVLPTTALLDFIRKEKNLPEPKKDAVRVIAAHVQFCSVN